MHYNFCRVPTTLRGTRAYPARLLQARRTGYGLNFLKARLAESHATVIIPFDERLIFVHSFDCTQPPRRRPEVPQTFNAISGVQFLVGGCGLGEPWFFSAV